MNIIDASQVNQLVLEGSNKKYRLENKYAVVTGGTKGIGRSIVDEFLSLGARVLTCSRNVEELEAAKQSYLAQGYSEEVVRIIEADVSTPNGRRRLTEACGEFCAERGLHILVNNVGTNRRKKSIEYTDDDYNFIFSTNLQSSFSLANNLYPLLKKSGKGCVVNVGSVAGGCSVAIKR